LIARRLGRVPERPVIVAPRGELSPGALAIRRWKKAPYLLLANKLGLLDGVIFQASAEPEKRDIERALGVTGKVVIARNLAVKAELDAAGVGAEAVVRRDKRRGRARFVFVSRVSPKKNLEYALRQMAGLVGEVSLEICGPIDDESYWRRCERIIAALPSNVTVTYRGPLPHDQVRAVFGGADGFVFPTSGENFGHVIYEALQAECPVLVSDNTPWGAIAESGAGWVLSLSDEVGWRAALQRCVDMTAEEHRLMAERSRFAISEFMSDDVVTQNHAMFEYAVGAGRH
jgi:glycosyltransferase involved in cell wall biosynthesis